MAGCRLPRLDFRVDAMPADAHGREEEETTMNATAPTLAPHRSPFAETSIPRTRSWGLALALVAAVISGVAVFTNSYGVKAFGDPTVYTTAKNLVAALVLLVVAAGVHRLRSAERLTRPRGVGQWAGLAAVGVIGGSVPFVLFFEGLARASSAHAAFIHKTLVIWVALFALPLLRERIGWGHVGAIALLVWGQGALGGTDGIRAGRGEAMILAATILWSIEVVLAKRLLRSMSSLTVAVARMGLGGVVLIGYTLATTSLGELTAIGPTQWGWALLTGLILAGYVGTWFVALSRARAVDVTAVLVLGAIITALLQAGVQGAALGSQAFGLTLVGAGVTGVVVVALRRPVLDPVVG
jgi:drug/metabolite transporter (DMT)-like permease